MGQNTDQKTWLVVVTRHCVQVTLCYCLLPRPQNIHHPQRMYDILTLRPSFETFSLQALILNAHILTLVTTVFGRAKTCFFWVTYIVHPQRPFLS